MEIVSIDCWDFYDGPQLARVWTASGFEYWAWRVGFEPMGRNSLYVFIPYFSCKHELYKTAMNVEFQSQINELSGFDYLNGDLNCGSVLSIYVSIPPPPPKDIEFVIELGATWWEKLELASDS